MNKSVPDARVIFIRTGSLNTKRTTYTAFTTKYNPFFNMRGSVMFTSGKFRVSSSLRTIRKILPQTKYRNVTILFLNGFSVIIQINFFSSVIFDILPRYIFNELSVFFHPGNFKFIRALCFRPQCIHQYVSGPLLIF